MTKQPKPQNKAGEKEKIFHDLRNSLTVMVGNLNLIEILLREQNDNLPLNKLMQNSKLEIQQIKKLLENLESAEE